jgi:hypothetical protein
VGTAANVGAAGERVAAGTDSHGFGQHGLDVVHPGEFPETVTLPAVADFPVAVDGERGPTGEAGE